jgi:4-amino-4-deoxy-L-arabinose transferase-like glycosyltransferase
VVVVSVFLTLFDGHAPSFTSWLAYATTSAISAILIWLVWRWMRAADGPRSLWIVVLIAFVLRLGVGWALLHALPLYGYDHKVQEAGYIFRDAYTRDRDAWRLVESDKPLTSAFTDRENSDQYGGMLFLSASFYRALSADMHRPLLIVILTAAAGAMTTLLIWRFTRVIFSPRAGTAAMWIAALQPDAVLLSASQMREPFLILALALLFYGYAAFREKKFTHGLLAILLGGVAVALPISPPTAFVGVGAVVLVFLWEGRLVFKRLRWALVAFVAIALLAVVFAARSWASIGTLESSGLQLILDWWRSSSDQWQLNLIWMQSSWIKQVFDRIPEWAHYPFVVVYGLLRPFLPAGIIDSATPLWRGIAIWRGLGWFGLLPFLVYAPFAALRTSGWRGLPTYLALLVWGTAVIASYRGAGDQWDNPRYRTIFLVAQASLAGWAWVHARRTRNPWLGRLVILVAATTVLFSVWYIFRVQISSVFGVVHVLLSIAAFVVMFLLGSLLFDIIRKRRVGA